MKALKLIGEISLLFLTLVAIFVDCFFIYFKVFNKDFTIGTNNINDQIAKELKKEEDLTQAEKDEYAERWFMEANYYSNSKKNGIELQELNFNYFDSYKLTEKDYHSTGMQYLGNYIHKDAYVGNDDELNKYVFKDFYYYDTFDHISYSGYYGNTASVTSLLKRSTTFTIKIDNRPFAIKLDKTMKSGWWIFGSTHYYTYSELFQSVFSAIRSNSKGFGTYYIKLDLSDFFTIYEYDENGKFKNDNVTDIIKNYAVMKFHYYENGAVASSQSLFGSIECNPKYDTSDNVDTDYWQERAVYTLSEKDLSYRFSDTYNGYFASLSLETKNKFKNMPRSKVKIKLDLNSEYLKDKNINLVGLDYNAFEKFEIDTFTILGNGNFNLLEKCLFDTKLQTLEKSKNINFTILSNAFNNEYKEVVI